MNYKVALFGEAGQGEIAKPMHFQSVCQLAQTLGHPPEDSLGIHCAVQALMHQREIFFFRVEEEGFSEKDYLKGLNNIRKHLIEEIIAIGLPGVGNHRIIESCAKICRQHRRLLITTEKDLYDYLTSFPQQDC